MSVKIKPIAVYTHSYKVVTSACTSVVLSLSLLPGIAFGQVSAPSAGASGAAPSEAARKAAESPYRWILINANNANQAKPVKKEAAPAPAPAPVAAKKAADAPAAAAPAAAEPVPIEVKPAPVVQAVAPVPTPVAAPAPVVAAVAPRPPPPPPPPKVNTELVIVTQVEPRFPAATLRDISTGTVKVSYTVNTDGSTGDVKVTSSMARALNGPVVAAIKEWKYKPIDIAQSTQIEFVFKPE